MAGAPLLSDSLAVLADVWRSGRSGTLILLGAGCRPKVPVVRGGVLELSHLSDLRRAVERGRLRFEFGAHPPGSAGDRAALGGLVLDLVRTRTSLVSLPLHSDAMVRLALDATLLRGLIGDRLLQRLERKPVAVGALLRDGSATVAELRALEVLDALFIEEPQAAQPAPRLPTPAAASPAAGPTIVPDSLPLAEPEPSPEPEPELDPDLLSQLRAVEESLSLGAPMAGPAPVLPLAEDDEDEILALHADEEAYEDPDLVGVELELDLDDEEEDEDPGELLAWAHEPGLDEDQGEDLFAMPEADLDEERDLGIVPLPEADEESLSQGDPNWQAIIAMGQPRPVIWTACADIEERVSDAVREGPRRAAQPRPDQLDAVAFGQDQADVWNKLDPDAAVAAADVVDWDEPAEPSPDELDTVDDLHRRLECAEDHVTDPRTWDELWGPDEEPSLALAHHPDDDTDEVLAMDRPAPPRRREEDTERFATAAVGMPEELTGELSGARLAIRDEVTAEIALELLRRARAELVDGRLAEARATLERASALAPQDATIEVHLAWTDLLEGSGGEAARRAMQAVARAPHDEVVLGLASAMAGHVGTTFRG